VPDAPKQGGSDPDEGFLRFEDALANDDAAGAARCLRELEAELGADDPDVAYARARLVWAEQGDEAAEPLLQRVLELDDEHAEAEYDLACLAEERGDHAEMVQRFLRVRALDALGDKASGIGTPEDMDTIESAARDVIDGLPEPFAERLQNVPVILERRPSRDLVQEGFDPRALGLFDGPTDAEQGMAAPTRIVLYACNLLAEFPEAEDLREQVEVTVLHEVGHFFGLDEDDLERLGLD
jgi:predicted Zn-dependent protease with MMP-like domain